MTEPVVAKATLLTFAPMIDSECCRLLLRHYAVPYQEEAHSFGWASVLALARGLTLQVPLLSSLGVRLAGPRAVAGHYEKICPPDKRLIPAHSLDAMQVTADWARFNGILASATAALAYYHLLPCKAIMIEPLSRFIPGWEARLVPAAYPALAGSLKLLLRLSPARADEAIGEIRRIFDETDARLADGRRFLVADRLSLSEIALASAAAPVLLPFGCGSPMPPLALMPEAFRTIVEEMRRRRTADAVQRIFVSLASA